MMLRERDRVRLIAIAQKNIDPPFQIWAFGSRVNGKSHDTSDLDIVFIKDREIDLNRFRSFQRDIRESNIPIIVQSFDWHRITDIFQQNIKNGYEVLHKED